MSLLDLSQSILVIIYELSVHNILIISLFHYILYSEYIQALDIIKPID